tara:strand:- start:579 stop:803 length:225 start_codon:yes stop_codon:yes gene_type:complete
MHIILSHYQNVVREITPQFRREKMIKVKIVKNTWAGSKRCWFIVADGMSLNYYGFTSKKAAIKTAVDAGATIID